MPRRALLIAYHFPPVQGSSGVQRALGVVRHLPEFGWEPLVLSAHPRAYPVTAAASLAEIPEGTCVERAFALDSARHLSIAGRYPAMLAAPDRWWTWWLGAVPLGLRMIRRYRPDVLWSTAPIATAHRIGATLARLSGLPWIADVRDLLTEPGDPSLPAAWRATRRIEQRTLRTATRTVVVSPGQRDEYLRRYPDLDPGRIPVIPNGYDEQSFQAAEATLAAGETGSGPPARRLRILHSGLLYAQGRDPHPLFIALREAIDAGEIRRDEVEIVLRASGSQVAFADLLERTGLTDVVSLPSPLGYREALAEMLTADGLLVIQGESCNTAIPAKLYEYMRARRPVLGLVHPDGYTHATLEATGYPDLADPHSPEQIRPVLVRFVERLREEGAFVPEMGRIEHYSRRAGTRQLADLFDELAC